MADKKDTKSPISAAPVAIATAAAPSREIALKGTTVTRYKAEPSEAPQNPNFTAKPAKTTEEIAFDRYNQTQLRENGHDLTSEPLMNWIKGNIADLGNGFDLNDKIDASYAAFQQANPSDRQLTANFERAEYSPFIYNPRTSHGRHSNSPNSIIDDGFKAPAFKLDKQEARLNLAADIKTVSDMYATEAGMSSKDFAKVLGGIATIESRFGVLRSVSGTKYASSAGGAFHYLDGTIAGEVRNSMSDPRISGRVNRLGVEIHNGVSKSEAFTLKEDNVLAGSILAKRVIEAVRKNPELKDDIAALTTRVYQSHNLGEAGASALARGGRNALEALDHKADDNNPMFFRGTSSDTEINNRYKQFVSNAVASSAALIENTFGSSTTLAQNRQQPVKVAVATLPSREPA